MKITLLQTDIRWASPEENIRRAEEMIDRSGHADLYVLPEMWATGFATEPEGIAEEESTAVSLAWMKETACKHDCAISGSLAIRDAEGNYRNRHYFVTPEQVTSYDKRHLFTHGHEDEHYTRGERAVIAEWKGWRLLMQTCYDLRFPIFSRYGLAGEYDAIIYVANWPEKRQLAWETLTRARAIENQCFVIAVNRVGDDEKCHYAGGSVVVDPIGHSICTAQTEEQSVCTELNMERLCQMRQRFQVLDDRDRL